MSNLNRRKILQNSKGITKNKNIIKHIKTTSINKMWTQALRRFKSYSCSDKSTRLQESSAMVPAEIEAKRNFFGQLFHKPTYHYKEKNDQRIVS